MKCGRQPEGHAAADSGVCPVAVCEELNGIHGGKNAGRACWAIDDSLCPDALRETPEKKFTGCWKCDFYQSVKNEERSSRDGFVATHREMRTIQNRLHAPAGVKHPGGPNARTRGN